MTKNAYAIDVTPMTRISIHYENGEYRIMNNQLHRWMHCKFAHTSNYDIYVAL